MLAPPAHLRLLTRIIHFHFRFMLPYKPYFSSSVRIPCKSLLLSGLDEILRCSVNILLLVGFAETTGRKRGFEDHGWQSLAHQSGASRIFSVKRRGWRRESGKGKKRAQDAAIGRRTTPYADSIGTTVLVAFADELALDASE
ncbi:uncharacterized protein LOC111273040 [Varroa jacobsoni]|uniref:uncharacterized protein LOC111273040 n=1 Tax=Varroa jacobsoni TaxID=62625 RepID=UPI000BF3AB31|nr:uncharacterized protein LOC111273040 [Varroa jacobsoni]